MYFYSRPWVILSRLLTWISVWTILFSDGSGDWLLWLLEGPCWLLLLSLALLVVGTEKDRGRLRRTRLWRPRLRPVAGRRRRTGHFWSQAACVTADLKWAFPNLGCFPRWVSWVLSSIWRLCPFESCESSLGGKLPWLTVDCLLWIANESVYALTEYWQLQRSMGVDRWRLAHVRKRLGLQQKDVQGLQVLYKVVRSLRLTLTLWCNLWVTAAATSIPSVPRPCAAIGSRSRSARSPEMQSISSTRTRTVKRFLPNVWRGSF